MSESFLRLPAPFIEIACRSLEEGGMLLCPHCHFRLFILSALKARSKPPGSSIAKKIPLSEYEWCAISSWIHVKRPPLRGLGKGQPSILLGEKLGQAG
jgi:hypothetical protein